MATEIIGGLEELVVVRGPHATVLAPQEVKR
jgi:hypothetical protein